MPGQQLVAQVWRSLKVACIAIFAITVSSVTAHGECTISQPLHSGYQSVTPPLWVGQSFVACMSGKLTAVRVSSGQEATATLGVTEGSGSSFPVNTQVVTLGIGDVTLTLTEPLSVTAGGTYSFALLGANVSLGKQVENVYADGNMLVTNWSSTHPALNTDLSFELQIEPDTSPTTPSPWTGIKLLYAEAHQ